MKYLSILLAFTIYIFANSAINKGAIAFRDGKYKKALEYWLPLAKKGDAVMQYNVGFLYLHGIEVQDLKKAAYWIKKSAHAGNINAIYNMGLIHKYGYGVKKDYKKAMMWYRRAAKRGHPVAMYGIAYLYYRGLGVKRNIKLAKYWWQKAVRNGDKASQKYLDRLCQKYPNECKR